MITSSSPVYPRLITLVNSRRFSDAQFFADDIAVIHKFRFPTPTPTPALLGQVYRLAEPPDTTACVQSCGYSGVNANPDFQHCGPGLPGAQPDANTKRAARPLRPHCREGRQRPTDLARFRQRSTAHRRNRGRRPQPTKHGQPRTRPAANRVAEESVKSVELICQ